jgi:hypothetical protein
MLEDSIDAPETSARKNRSIMVAASGLRESSERLHAE